MVIDDLSKAYKLGRPNRPNGETIKDDSELIEELNTENLVYVVHDNRVFESDRTKVIDASSVLDTEKYNHLFSPTDIRAYPTMTQGPWVITKPGDRDRNRDFIGFTNVNLHRRLDAKIPDREYREELEDRNFDGITPYKLYDYEEEEDTGCCKDCDCCDTEDTDIQYTDEIAPREYSVQIQGVHSFRNTRKIEHMDYQDVQAYINKYEDHPEYADIIESRQKASEDKEIP